MWGSVTVSRALQEDYIEEVMEPQQEIGQKQEQEQEQGQEQGQEQEQEQPVKSVNKCGQDELRPQGCQRLEHGTQVLEARPHGVEDDRLDRDHELCDVQVSEESLEGHPGPPAWLPVPLPVHSPDERLHQLGQELHQLEDVFARVGRVIVALEACQELAEVALCLRPSSDSGHDPPGSSAAVQLLAPVPHVGLVVVDGKTEHLLDPGEDAGQEVGGVDHPWSVLRQSGQQPQ